MASGSVDQTVLLWDLETKEPHTSLTCFQEKIQALKWHPFEGQTLLTGSADKYVYNNMSQVFGNDKPFLLNIQIFQNL